MITNFEIASAFKEAKKRLQTGGGYQPRYHRFICFALEDSWLNGPCSKHQYRVAREIIESRMGARSLASYSIECWLVDNKVVTNSWLCKPNSRAIVQEYRHRWLDALIKEFSDKPD